MKVKDILKGRSVWMPNPQTSEPPIVSVLLPTFRRGKSGFFRNAVQSLLSQSFARWELIIVDDCSSDGTFDQIQAFMQQDRRIHAIRHSENIGLPAISEFEAYQKARGEYIAFLFDDCTWEKTALSDALEFLQSHQLKACYGICSLRIDESQANAFQLDAYSTSNIFAANHIGNSSVVLHRDVIETVGLYDPHLSLTRLCDWDLWRRIVRKFPIEATHYPFSVEYGVSLSDSLGNTYDMNAWVSEETMNLDRDAQLLPAVFEDYDILDTSGGKSQFFLEAMQAFSKHLQNKGWFSVSDPSYVALFEKNSANSAKKRVLVVATALSASTSLYLNRWAGKGHVTLRFQTMHTLNNLDLGLVDAVVLARDLVPLQNIQILCNQLDIPTYYFIDDNFIELAKDFPNDGFIQQMAEHTNQETLSSFRGVFCSSEALTAYFKAHRLHEHVGLLPISLDRPPFVPSIPKDHLHIAFMGTAFREGMLTNIVFPAIERISKNVPTRLFLPFTNDEELDKLRHFETDRFSIAGIPKTFSLELFLQRFQNQSIDILVHPGIETRNNIYKTQNALLNALQIGAALIASNLPPYPPLQCSEPVSYLTADNTVDGWCIQLERLAEPGFRKQVFDTAHAYALEQFSPEDSIADFKKEMETIDAASLYTTSKRYQNLMRLPDPAIQKQTSKLNNMGFSGAISKSRSYKVTCSSDCFSKVGIVFCPPPNEPFPPNGTISIEIFSDERLLSKSTLTVDRILIDEWTYFPVDSTSGYLNQLLSLKITIELPSPMGVRENSSKQTLVYRVFRKLHMPLKTNDILFVQFCS